MAVKICVNEITSQIYDIPQKVTCCPTCPDHSCVGTWSYCDVSFIGTPSFSADYSYISFSFLASLGYKRIDPVSGMTCNDICTTICNESLDIVGAFTCCGMTPSLLSSITISAPFTFTGVDISATVTKSFTIDDLCVPTIICVDTVACP